MVSVRGLFLCMFFFLSVLNVSASAPGGKKDGGMQLDEQQWRDITDGADYSENYQERAEREEPSGKPDTGSYKYLIYALLAGGVALAIWRIFKTPQQNVPVTPDTPVTTMTLDEAEEHLHEADLGTMLSEALGRKDFRLALRVRFLILIRELSEKGKINWAREKTNGEYYREISEKLLADRFKYIVKDFERYWYGEHPLDERQYESMMPAYHELQTNIRA